MSADRFTVQRISFGANAGKFAVGYFPPVGYIGNSVIMPREFSKESTAHLTADTLNAGWDSRKQMAGEVIAQLFPDRAIKHESEKQKGLFFWAEYNPAARGIGPASWMVVSQADGFPGTEANDDWFANWKDADEIAQQLAKGEL